MYGSYTKMFLQVFFSASAKDNALEFRISDVFSLNVIPKNKTFALEVFNFMKR